MSECLKHLRVVAHLQSQPQKAETATEENFQPQVSTGTYEEVYTLTQETQTHGTWVLRLTPVTLAAKEAEAGSN